MATGRFLCIVLATLLVILHHGNAYPSEQLDSLYVGFRMLWGLLVVLAVILIIYVILKKKLSVFQQNANGIIKIIEVRHIMPKKSLMIIEVRGQEYLVGSGSDTINTIIPLADKSTFDTFLQDSKQNPLI